MKSVLKLTAFVVAGVWFHLSCQKEFSLEGAFANKSPIAIAGLDKVIQVPANSVILDGSASTDPDGIIVSYQWTKISGPSSFTIINNKTIQTLADHLVQGVYQFELKVTDANGLFSTDTVQVTVEPSSVSCSAF